jgi:NDP-sugar pyrophosphorylase family protein
MEHNTDLVILCGGLGKRLRSIVDDRPKVMSEINGKPFLEILIKYIKCFGFKKIILCTGHLGHMIQNYFGNGIKYDIEIVYSQEEVALGTAGAIKNAERIISSNPFFVLNGDSFTRINFYTLISFHLQNDADISIPLVKIKRPSRYGTVSIGDNSRITQFLEKDETCSEGWVNTGVYLLSKKILASIPLNSFFSLEKNILSDQTNNFRIFGMPVDCKFIDIGTPESYSHLAKNYNDYFEDTFFKSESG